MEALLKALKSKIEALAEAGLQSGDFASVSIPQNNYKVPPYKYSLEYGVGPITHRVEQGTISSWVVAVQNGIQQIENTDEFLACAAFPKIYNFMRKIFQNCFEDGSSGNDELLNQYILELSGGTAHYHGIAFLGGLTIESDRIEVAEGIIINKPLPQDIEGAISSDVTNTIWKRLTLQIVAINVENDSDSEDYCMEEIERAVMILRLFKVSSVKQLSYQCETNSVSNPHNLHVNIPETETIVETNCILATEEDRLRGFWSSISEVITPEFLKGSNSMPIKIAYHHYFEALMAHGLFEKRIANIGMGLEALLTTKEPELKYKLSNRAATVLSLISGDSKQIRDFMKDLYDIRSKYAHGDILSPKEVVKYEKKCGDLNEFLVQALDYLRQLICASILDKTNTKDQLIKKIDDSLLSNVDRDTLSAEINIFKNLIC